MRVLNVSLLSVHRPMFHVDLFVHLAFGRADNDWNAFFVLVQNVHRTVAHFIVIFGRAVDLKIKFFFQLIMRVPRKFWNPGEVPVRSIWSQ